VQPKRARAPSDPFLDTPALSHSIPTSSSLSSGTTALLSAIASEEPPSPISLLADLDDFTTTARSDRDRSFDYEPEDEHLRVWTSPDLANPEYITLLKVFPPFITRRAITRFPATKNRQRDVEEAEEERANGLEIHVGTGTMWVSSKLRRNGWNGGLWSRFVSWWRRVFSFC